MAFLNIYSVNYLLTTVVNLKLSHVTVLYPNIFRVKCTYSIVVNFTCNRVNIQRFSV